MVGLDWGRVGRKIREERGDGTGEKGKESVKCEKENVRQFQRKGCKRLQLVEWAKDPYQ